MKKIQKLFSAKPWIALLCCMLLPVYLELTLHLFIYHSLTVRFLYVALFSAAYGSLFYAICTVLPKRIANAVFLIGVCVLVLYFEIQLVYHSIFSEFMSLWQFSFGAEAVTNFWRQMLYGILSAIVPILVLLIPVPLFCILIRVRALSFRRTSWAFPVISLALFFAFYYGNLTVMRLSAVSRTSVYSLYCDPATTTEASARNIGLLSTARLEIKYLVTGEEPGGTDPLPENGNSVVIPKEERKNYQMLDLDFGKLKENAESPVLSELDSYFSTVMPTKKNEYTGICKGYNLIALCAESYSPEFLDPELTPALWKLTHEGFVFNNYYGSYTSNTTNGEYTFCMGLYPDLSRKKSSASMYASVNNYLPFCFGNLFKADGAKAYAYHNYLGEYYNRDMTHPNMGYDFRAVKSGLDMEVLWPASDLEMMRQACGQILDGNRFCAYFMTFSGHYQYDFDNEMSKKNRGDVEGLPYSETVRAYIACNLELEYAMQHLLSELEKAGVADKTVIVLTNDHYPYGLTETEYNELAGREVDPLTEKFRNSFICYVPGITKEVDTYCSTVDILPTVLNLFGFSYDSRLLAGHDVLSADADNVAVLYDRSFITPDVIYRAATGELVKKTDRAVSDEEIAAIRNRIDRRFDISEKILSSDYYAHALNGATNSGTLYDRYDFEDMPETVEMGAVRFAYDNGYIEPLHERVFGFEQPCRLVDLYRALYRMAGSPAVTAENPEAEALFDETVGEEYRDACRWAYEIGIVYPWLHVIGLETPVCYNRLDYAIAHYAAWRGCDTSVDDGDIVYYEKKHEGLTLERYRALKWCFDHKITVGTGKFDEKIDAGDDPMKRLNVIYALFHYHVYIEP